MSPSRAPLCTRSPPSSSLNSRRKASDTFSMARMIINFKKFKSIHFSLRFEVCKGKWKEGLQNTIGGEGPCRNLLPNYVNSVWGEKKNPRPN